MNLPLNMCKQDHMFLHNYIRISHFHSYTMFQCIYSSKHLCNYFILSSFLMFVCFFKFIYRKGTGVLLKTFQGLIHWGMLKFFEKLWRDLVSIWHLPEYAKPIRSITRQWRVLCLLIFTLHQYFEQALMRMPSSNFWEVVPTSRGFQWLQPIKPLMGRYVL